MKTLRARLHHLFAAVVAFGLLGLGATDAQATHFRYGTLRWEVIPTNPPDPNAVRIKVTTESAWRRSFPWPGGGVPQVGVPLNTSYTIQVQRISPQSNLASAPLVVIPSSVNTTEDWFVGSTIVEFQFPAVNLPVRIFWASNARVSNLQDGNNDRPFRIEAVMSATPNAASPAASILPIITVGFPSPAATFFIPAGDVEGDTLTWGISPLARSGLIKAVPDGVLNTFPTLAINPLTGEVTWNTAQELTPVPGGHYYAVQFLVTDSKGGETPVDALLRLIQTVPNPPIATINGSEEQHIVDVRPNNPVSFTLTGTDIDPGATVTLTTGALPPGASMTPSLPTSGSSPQSSVFNWTPTLAQAGNSYTVSFAVTDEFANQDTISALIRVLENFPPTIVCPDDAVAEADGPGGASSVSLEATVSDLDPDALTIQWFVDGALVATQNATGPGSTVMTHTQAYSFIPSPHAIRVTVDDGQALRECTSTVTVVDTTPPSIPPMDDVVVEATDPTGATATWITPTATDTVDGPLPVTCAPVSGSPFPLNAPPPPSTFTTVTCTATDTRGNMATETFTVEVRDTTPPAISGMPADMTVEATGASGAPASWTSPTAHDIVDLARPVTCVPASGSTFPLGVTTVSCSASDIRGNTSTETFTVTVSDTTPPVVTVEDATAEATGPDGAQVTYDATAEDLVDGSLPVNCTPPPGSTFPLGTTTVTCTATDSSGNVGKGTGTVTVTDTGAPVVTVPDTTAEATSAAGAVVTFVATAFDLVDGDLPVDCEPESGSTFPLGATTVTCTATDSHGNVGTGTGVVTVVDTTPPVISGTSDQVREATGPDGASVSWPAPTATDLVDPDVPVICAPASGSTFAITPPAPVATVTCTATDDSGNTATATFTVRVEDTTPPVISNMPADMTVSATGPTGANVTWPAPTAMDIVDLVRPVTCVPASGSFFLIGTTTVTCTASDTRGNSSSATFTVTVIDDTPPPVTVSLNPGVLWPPNHKMVNIQVLVTSEPGAVCHISNVTSNQPINGTGDGDTSPDWIFSGMNLQLRAERAGNLGRGSESRIYTVTVTCIDINGNIGTGTATAIVPHDMRDSR